ncbi:MAG TPA: hypothetical protein RMH85_19805 [Polyangiaceae bacterium LLY-WYZ-15_(1-7)]|nr:hypothetical protein [Sandaracinus sp.]HJK95352.1 hypothetical protein [Polyangiaceae bacterium LLY-WYZ-15_(1-7)]HJL00501.1 hypothetical protein [Polyangiaceae bacterium LLY-WYZ-15_(1-7)]HJL10727.1 hypothetical protein [Polyangiaceae bacterium LLY-WYZ-15_(1-7)]HJL20585.1 hypothetical protein [Polyangiaceae bacterium LLY-WYZ-15_(1-7)]
MRRLTPVLVALAACTAASDPDTSVDPRDGVAEGAQALEGTREGHGVLRLLNDGESATFVFLDDVVALDRRAAAHLVEHRDGLDGRFGTDDDDLFETIAEVDGVSWVGPAALERLAAFARSNDYVPGDDDLHGTFDGVSFTWAEAEAVLAYVNEAAPEALREASVPSRAVTSIVEARPIDSVATLADLYWVGPRTLEHLQAAVAGPVGGEDCARSDECAEGLSCVGRAPGLGLGKCQDTRSPEGAYASCDADAACAEGLVCIAQTVYGEGYCAAAWMRDTFEVGGVASIPGVEMDEPMAFPFWVYGQASVPEDILLEVDLAHDDPSSLWIGLQPPTGQEAVTVWDGATATEPFPGRFVDRRIYRDDMVNGEWALLVRNVGGRGEGELRGFALTVSSRWD